MELLKEEIKEKGNTISSIDTQLALNLKKGLLAFLSGPSLDPDRNDYCCLLYHPKPMGGIMIGKGYDMKNRTKEEIERDLKKVGVSPEVAQKMSEASGLYGKEADNFIKNNKKDLKLEVEQIIKLFQLDYEKLENLVERKCGKYEIDYSNLPEKIKEEITGMFKYEEIKDKEVQEQFMRYFHKQQQEKQIDLENIAKKLIEENANKNADNLFNYKIKNIYKEIENIKNIKNQLDKPKSRNSTISRNASTSDSLIDDSEYENPKGGIDLSKISAYFVKKRNVTGLYISTQEKHLAYLLTDSTPILVGIDVSILAVALLAEFNNESIAFSLDPWEPTIPDGPIHRKVYFPSWVAGTDFGNILFEADYLLKQLSFGIRVTSISPAPEYTPTTIPHSFPESIKMKGLKTVLEYDAERETKDKNTRWYRLWIEIKECTLKEVSNSDKEKVLSFDKMLMEIQARRMIISKEESVLKDAIELNNENDGNERFARKATEIYDELAKYYPEFAQVRELAKATALAKVLKDLKIPVDIAELQRIVENNKSKNAHDYKVPALKTSLEIKKENTIRTITMFGGVSLNQKNTSVVKEAPSQPKIKNEVKIEDSKISKSLEEEKKLIVEKLKECMKTNDIIPFPFVVSNANCSFCDTKVNWNGFYYPFCKEESKFYCELHHPDVCMICHQSFQVGIPYKLLGKEKDSYHLSGKAHKGCLLCDQCGHSLDSSYISLPGKKPNYENIVYDSYFHEKCFETYKKILEDDLPSYTCVFRDCPYKDKIIKYKDKVALGKDQFYHEDCIRCRICKNQIKESSIKAWFGMLVHSDCVKKIDTKIIVSNGRKALKHAIEQYKGKKEKDFAVVVNNSYKEIGCNSEYVSEKAWPENPPRQFFKIDDYISGAVIVFKNGKIGFIIDKSKILGLSPEGIIAHIDYSEEEAKKDQNYQGNYLWLE